MPRERLQPRYNLQHFQFAKEHKFQFLSPLGNFLSLSRESVITVWRSLCVSRSLCGAKLSLSHTLARVSEFVAAFSLSTEEPVPMLRHPNGFVSATQLEAEFFSNHLDSIFTPPQFVGDRTPTYLHTYIYYQLPAQHAGYSYSYHLSQYFIYTIIITMN